MIVVRSVYNFSVTTTTSIYTHEIEYEIFTNAICAIGDHNFSLKSQKNSKCQDYLTVLFVRVVSWLENQNQTDFPSNQFFKFLVHIRFFVWFKIRSMTILVSILFCHCCVLFDCLVCWLAYFLSTLPFIFCRIVMYGCIMVVVDGARFDVMCVIVSVSFIFSWCAWATKSNKNPTFFIYGKNIKFVSNFFLSSLL